MDNHFSQQTATEQLSRALRVPFSMVGLLRGATAAAS